MRRFDLVVVHAHRLSWSMIDQLWDGRRWTARTDYNLASRLTAVFSRKGIHQALKASPSHWPTVMASVTVEDPTGVVLFNNRSCIVKVVPGGVVESLFESVTAHEAAATLEQLMAVHEVHEG